ncbi:MAG: redox-sensing transcriptional repressor Rex [Armatimonadota bacterium]|nr:redox-sensing transcriptional repressor Rex [Armatimonadota bacterium]
MNALSACGLYDCSSCEYKSADRCPGCFEGNKKLKADGAEICSIYDCAVSGGVATCADCARPLCDIPRMIDCVCPLRAAFQTKRWWAGRLSNFFETRNRKLQVDEQEKKISPRTVERLRWYLLVLQEMDDRGVVSVASREIAGKIGVNAALVRKDLSYFGDFGTPSYGYTVRYLIERIRQILNLDEPCHVAWVGAQRLAENQELLLELGSHNCKVVTVLDIDETRVGARVAGIRVEPLAHIGRLAKELDVNAGVVAVPAQDAQKVADALLAVGVKALLNLTSTVLSVPPGVVVRHANVVSEMMALSFYSANEELVGEA